MKIGVIIPLNAKINETLKELHDLGFDSCQMTGWNSVYFTDEYVEIVKKATEEYGITITAFWCGWEGPKVWDFYEGPLTLGLVPKEYRFDRAKMILRGSEFAQKLGITDIVTHVGFMPENPKTTEYSEMIAILKYICRILKTREQYFLFETGQETPVTLRRTIEDIGTDNVGINLDPANLILYGKGNPVDALTVFGEYVRNIHGKDGNYPTDGHHLGHETPIGEGSVDFPRFIKKLKEIGYTGPITIEREISGDQQIKDILAAREYLTTLIESDN